MPFCDPFGNSLYSISTREGVGWRAGCSCGLLDFQNFIINDSYIGKALSRSSYASLQRNLPRAYSNFYKVKIGPLHDPVTWYGINFTGTQIAQWDFQNKGKPGWTGKSSFVLEVPLRYLRPSVIYSVPCDWILQRAYSVCIAGFSGDRNILISCWKMGDQHFLNFQP